MLSPKTRGPGASQQPARIGDPLVTDLLTNVFGSLPTEQSLWLLSPSAFRSRFRAIGKVLGMPQTFTPASLRGSGATFLDETTENTDLVARHGRWMSQKTMNIYLHEVQVASVLPQFDVSEKHRILSLYDIELFQNGIGEQFVAILVCSPTRPPSTTTYTSGSLA